MKIDLDTVLQNLTNMPQKRPSLEFLQAMHKGQKVHGQEWLAKLSDEERTALLEKSEVDMTLGYFLCESLPHGIPETASQQDKIKMAKLQRRCAKGGEQAFTKNEIDFMKDAAWAYPQREYLFLADEAASLLDGDSEEE